jgi:uncharacterized coiled-coil DUF342 family protein
MAAVVENNSASATTEEETNKDDDIPKLPPRMAKPDRYNYENTINDLNNEIESIKMQRSKILKTIKLRQSGGAGFRDEKDKARKTMGVLVKTKNGIMDERKVLFAQRDAIRAATDRMKEASRNMKGELGRYTSVQDIDNKIRQLHHRQNTTNMSLSEEKDLIKQIDQLTGMKKTVDAFARHNDKLRKEADSGKGLSTLISEKNKALKEIGEKIVQAKKNIEAIEARQNTAQADVSPLRDQLDSLKKEQEKKIAVIKEKRKQWKVVNDEYYEYVKELRKVKAIIRKKEDEAYQREKEIRRKELEAELATQKPWLQELALCDVLIKYLTGLLPKEETASEKQAAPAKKANERLANSFAGMKIMKKKDDEEDYFRAQQQTGKKKRKNKKKQAKKAMREKDLVHTFDTLQNFQYLKSKSGLDLYPPSCTEDIPDTLDLLKKCSDYFDTLPREVKSSNSDGSNGKNKKMKTDFGEGTFVEKRADGVKVVKLSWAKLYTK